MQIFSLNWTCWTPTTLSTFGREMSGRRHLKPPLVILNIRWCLLVFPTPTNAVFQALISDIICDMPNHFVFVYLDDINILQDPEQAHWASEVGASETPRKQVLRQTWEVWVSLNQSHLPGFCDSARVLQLDPTKIRAVEEWPTPSNYSWDLPISNVD